MKKFFFSVLVLVSWCSISYAQNFHWEWCHGPNIGGPYLMGFNRNGDLVVSAQDNWLDLSSDHGGSWKPVALPRFYYTAAQIVFTASSHILVLRVTPPGYGTTEDSALLVRVSPDGTDVEAISRRYLTFISANTRGVTNAIEDSSLLLESLDEGTTWDTIATPAGLTLAGCVKTDSGTYIIATQNGLYRNAALSPLWQQVLVDTNDPNLQLQADAYGRIFITNDQYSTDDGVTWNTSPSWSNSFPVASDRNGDVMYSSSDPIHLTNKGTLLKLVHENGSVYRDSSGSWWLSGAIINSNNEYTNGLFFSDDSLNNWNYVPYPMTNISTVFAHSQFLVSGSYGYSLEFSTDWGQTWVSRNSPINGSCSFGEDSTHRLLLFAGYGGEQSYSSTDTGRTWNEFLWSHAVGMTGISMAVTPSGNFFAAQTITLVKSTDQGVTWDTLLPANKIIPHLDNNLYSTVVATEHRILVGTDSGYQYSTDGGNVWEDTVFDFNPEEGFFLQSRGNYVLATHVYPNSFSTDEGVTWRPLQIRGNAFAIFPSGALLALSDSVYYVRPGDTAMESINSGLEGYDLSNMTAAITADGIPYLALENVGVFKGVGTLPMSGVATQNDSIEVPLFPNPATTYVTAGTGTITQATAYDVLGHPFPLSILSRENGGSRLDVSNLPIGLYYLRVSDDGGIHSAPFCILH